MSAALIRTCPNQSCKKPTIKEAGCNKMSCSVWSVRRSVLVATPPTTITDETSASSAVLSRTLFCYVCTAIVKDYSHFDQQPDNYAKAKDGKKCPLWEDMAARHAKEVSTRISLSSSFIVRLTTRSLLQQVKEARDVAQAELRARGEDIAEEDIGSSAGRLINFLASQS